MTTKTIDGLRAMLEERASEVTTPPALAARTAGLARGVRTRRRMVMGGVAAVAVASAVVVPIAVGWPGGDDGTDPAVPSTQSPDGSVTWTLDLPGVDLPLGGPLTAPYVGEDGLIIDGSPVALDEVGEFISTPDGVLVNTGFPSGPSSTQAASLELVRADGSIENIDSGVIAGAAAARQTDGSILVAYGWLASPTATIGEVRVVELGSDQPPEVIPVEPAATVLGLEGRTALIGRSGFDPGGEQAWLDLDTGEREPVGAEGASVWSEGTTAGGLVVRWDEDAQCLTASDPDGAEVWARCDQLSSFGLSPDGRWILTRSGGTLDAETGEDAATFDLPPDAREMGTSPPGFRIMLMGWEDVDHPVYQVTFVEAVEQDDGTTGGVSSAYVDVRCSVSTGECERIPHSVGPLGPIVG